MSPLVPIFGGLAGVAVLAASDWLRARPRCYFCGGRRHWLGACTGESH